jgi:hypothetical protein
MESHPEEFGANGSGRWAEWLDQLIPFVTEEERVMLRKPMIQDIHEDVLDELLNGPERRAEEMRKHEEDAQRYRQHQQAMQQQMAAQQSALGQYQNAAATGIVGRSATNVWMDESGKMSTIAASQPETTLSTSTINAIKKALKL